MLAEHALTAVEKTALLKEVIPIHKRRFAAGHVEEIKWSRHPGAKTVMAALTILGDELMDVGDREGAMACLRMVAELNLDDRLGCRMALDALEGVGRRRSVCGR